jgi:large subunit ribosomal protein L15
MRLNQISDNPGATRSRKRVGRGASSGLGKTSGKGQKGQKSRSGVAIKGFEGGQMPIYRRLPKRGFTNVFRKNFREINIGRLQAAIDAGKIDAGKPIDAETLVAAGMIKSARDGVRLLAKGELKANITITVAGASKAAVSAVEGAGGTVTVTMPAKAPAENKDAAD